jgi:hypothetical protein
LLHKDDGHIPSEGEEEEKKPFDTIGLALVCIL